MMKTVYLFAITALIASAGAAYAADCPTCYVQPNANTICPSCHAPAWDRTPQCEVRPPARATCPPQAPRVVVIDPWARCGAFCAASQLSPGWPYGWNAEYWLRPDSNF